MAALAKTTDPKLADLLVHDWQRHSPQVRSAILDALLESNGVDVVVAFIARGWLRAARRDRPGPAAAASRGARTLRSRHAPRRSSPIRPGRARRSSIRSVGRSATKGDRAAGAAVFKKLCASCHRLGNEGVEVGPDLAALADKSPESLLIAILDPNRAFETKYAGFTVATTDGRVLNGLVANESATAVTLRRQDGKEDVLLRSQIDEMTSSGQSLMPEGIEKDLKPRDLADLIAFLASTGAVKTPE